MVCLVRQARQSVRASQSGKIGRALPRQDFDARGGAPRRRQGVATIPLVGLRCRARRHDARRQAGGPAAAVIEIVGQPGLAAWEHRQIRGRPAPRSPAARTARSTRSCSPDCRASRTPARGARRRLSRRTTAACPAAARSCERPARRQARASTSGTRSNLPADTPPLSTSTSAARPCSIQLRKLVAVVASNAQLDRIGAGARGGGQQHRAVAVANLAVRRASRRPARARCRSAERRRAAADCTVTTAAANLGQDRDLDRPQHRAVAQHDVAGAHARRPAAACSGPAADRPAASGPLRRRRAPSARPARRRRRPRGAARRS